jgi:GT2 family glycosyltransferase
MLIDVVIPACGRCQELERCLRALPSDASIVVTDDSRDGAVREMLAARFPKVRWVAGPRRGPAANRNNGARAATKEWIVFLDDDCIPQPGWLTAFARREDAEVIEGRTVCPDPSDNPFTEQVENLTGDNFWSCNLAIRRSVFFELGGFDEDFTEAAGEDMEFAWRIRRRGSRTAYVPEAEVQHPARPPSLARFWRRTWMIRWMVLYRLKTGQSPARGASALRIYGGAVRREIVGLFRLTAQVFTRPDRRRPRTQIINVVHHWLTFPAVLCWQLLWERRFRRRCSAPRSCPTSA